MKLFKKSGPKFDIDVQTLERAKDVIEDVLFDLKTKRKQNEAKLKALLQKNEFHPMLVMNLKRSKAYIQALTNFSEMIDGLIDTAQFSSALNNLQKDKNMRKVASITSNVAAAMKDVNVTLRDMMRQQNKFINSTMGIVTNLTTQQNAMNETVDAFSNDILGDINAEILKDLIADDPKFLDTLPEEIKKRYNLA